MRKKLLSIGVLVITAGILLTGMVSKKTAGAVEFRVFGMVVDASNGEPVPRAGIFFVDTGLAPEPAEQGISKRIGASGEDGRVDNIFVYSWSCDRPLLSEVISIIDPPENSFEIEVRKEGFRTFRKTFNCSMLAHRSFTKQVPLEIVEMPRQG